MERKPAVVSSIACRSRLNSVFGIVTDMASVSLFKFALIVLMLHLRGCRAFLMEEEVPSIHGVVLPDSDEWMIHWCRMVDSSSFVIIF
jgi:hypothetical protein